MQDTPMTAEGWETPPQAETATTLEAMDNLVSQIKNKRQEYEEKKKQATAAHDDLEILQNEMVALLKANGRKSYHAPGVGKVGYKEVEQYTTPKTNDAKQALFGYIRDKYGEEVLTSMVSINSNTLKGWANKETESGEVQRIPGLEQPTMVEIPSFTKEK